MTEASAHPAEEALVYMVSGEDGNGDTHVLVTTDRQRAEQRHQRMVRSLVTVKANWLDPPS